MELVEAVRQGDEAALTEAIRERRRHTESWSELRALSQEVSSRLLQSRGALTARALAHHPNGYVREAAVRRLVDFSGEGFEDLILRVGDWVTPVASTAWSAIETLLPQVEDGELIRAASAFQSLLRMQRRNFIPLIHHYQAEIAGRPGLARRARAASSGVFARWLFVTLRGTDESEESVVRQGLAHADPGVQNWAAHHAADFPELWGSLRNARSARLRRFALDRAPKEALEAALIDPHAGVRNDARYLLGERDYAAHYRATLPTAGAISGLGETGTSADVELLRPFLGHPQGDMRRRALMAIARLADEAALPDLVAALNEPSRKTQKIAVDTLKRLVVSLDPEAIVGMNLSRYAAWTLMDVTPRWQSLLSVLKRLERFPDAEAWIDRWAVRAARYPIKPTSAEAVDVTVLIQECQTLLSLKTLTEIRAAVRSEWG